MNVDPKMYIHAHELMGVEAYKQTAAFRVKLPLGRSGPWRVRQFETRMDIQYLRFVRDGRAPGIGRFTALNHDDRGMVMSDTVPEVTDLLPHLAKLRGKILITGLGLGMVVHALTKHPKYKQGVESITVVEKERDVIKLVGKYYASKKVTIVNADAYEWEPPKGTRYDAAWHDIWDAGGSIIKPEVRKIKVHYRPYVSPGQQFAWTA